MHSFPPVQFYLGANTPGGFYSLFSELYDPQDDWTVSILKGGPGTGKSGLMRTIAGLIEQEGYPCERILCSADPESLDAVIFPENKAVVADGTAPHVLDPRYPGICENIINLGAFWDADALKKNASAIRRLTALCNTEHRSASRFLAAAASADADIFRTVIPLTETESVQRYALRIAAKELGGITAEVPAVEKKRFLSVITHTGINTRYDTIEALCDKTVAIHDNFGYVSQIFMAQLRKAALERGIPVISCCCPMNPGKKTEHLIFPEQRLCYFTANNSHPQPDNTIQVIRSGRFTDNEELKQRLIRLSFNLKARTDLIAEAVKHLECAKNAHNLLESYYIESMDFSTHDAIAKKTAAEILSR